MTFPYNANSLNEEVKKCHLSSRKCFKEIVPMTGIRKNERDSIPTNNEYLWNQAFLQSYHPNCKKTSLFLLTNGNQDNLDTHSPHQPRIHIGRTAIQSKGRAFVFGGRWAISLLCRWQPFHSLDGQQNLLLIYNNRQIPHHPKSSNKAYQKLLINSKSSLDRIDWLKNLQEYCAIDDILICGDKIYISDSSKIQENKISEQSF